MEYIQQVILNFEVLLQTKEEEEYVSVDTIFQRWWLIS
jgi:hypothetical protein